MEELVEHPEKFRTERFRILLGDRYSFFSDLSSTIQNFGKYFNLDALSVGQLTSKEWVVKELENLDMPLGTVFLLCGWYGILPALMFYSALKFDKIRSFDIDDEANKVADSVNKTFMTNNWTFKAITQDIFEINFSTHEWQCWSKKNNRLSYPICDEPDTIINTACEHTTDEWFEKIPKGKLVILQSTDSFNEEGHVNAVSSLDEFVENYPVESVHFAGWKQFDHFNDYIRYMLIGVK